jgi:preprotein translocase subunit SecA
LSALSDEALSGKTAEFRKRVEAARRWTTCFPKPSRSAARRPSVLGMRHFDVQLLGGMVLHNGKIAEMRTGEGKTLTRRCPCT